MSGKDLIIENLKSELEMQKALNELNKTLIERLNDIIEKMKVCGNCSKVSNCDYVENGDNDNENCKDWEWDYKEE